MGTKKKEGFMANIQKKLNPTKQISGQQVAFKEAKEKLKLRTNTVVSGLGGIGLQAAPLDTQEVVELLYSWYNPDTSGEQVLADLDKLQVERLK